MTSTSFADLLARAADLDEAMPPLVPRSGWRIPEGMIYLDGNSLGALSAAAVVSVERALEEWGELLIGGWDAGWMGAPRRLGDRIAPLIGARSGEVLIADTTSIALTKLLVAALRARPDRRVIVTSNDNFPSDLYVMQGAARMTGAEVRIVDGDGDEAIAAALDGDVAVLCCTHVDFRSGLMHDLPALTGRAHAAGALVLWDLCHSVGAVPVGCEEHGVDLAVGCTYKYLSGGPGSPSFLYVRRSLQDEMDNPLPGWLGHRDPFEFGSGWEQGEGIGGMLTSSPGILSMASLEGALSVFEGVSIEEIRRRSVSLTELFIEAIDVVAPLGMEVASPRDPARRGSQVALRHDRAAELVPLLAAAGVVPDFRTPDVVRCGFAPMYVTHLDAVRAAGIVGEVAGALGA